MDGMRQNAVGALNRVVHHDVLSRQLQQHGIVEELVDRDVFAESLAPARLDHKLPGECRCGLCLKGPDRYRLVQGISGNNLPMVEHGQTEGLALGVRPQVCLEPKRVNGWDEGLSLIHI